MDGATARPDGTDVSGRHPAAENNGKVARVEGGSNTPRPAMWKPRALANHHLSNLYLQLSMLAQPVIHSTPLHACLLCGHTYSTRPHGMLTHLALHCMACLPIQLSIIWHACLICGDAYPSHTPPHSMLDRSVGMLTIPHSTTWHACLICGDAYLYHIACLPDLWACLPIPHSTTMACLPYLWARLPNQHSTPCHDCMPELCACLPIQHLPPWWACLPILASG